MPACIICSAKVKTLTIQERMIGTNEFFNYNQCTQCGHTAIDEIPVNLSKYYNSKIYYSFRKKNNILFKTIVRKILLRAGWVNNLFFSSAAKPILCLPEINTASKILDFGCGAGNLVTELRSIGYSNSFGFDIFLPNDDSNLAENFITNKYNEISKTKWDLITLNHVFEHFTKPTFELEEVISLLSQNGVIILRFPVIDSHAFDLYLQNWAQFDAPRHINLFTRKSFKIFIEKISSIYISKIYDDSYHFQFTGSEIYKRGETLVLGNSKLKRLLSPSTYLYHFKAKKLNKESRGDQIVAVLNKKN